MGIWLSFGWTVKERKGRHFDVRTVLWSVKRSRLPLISPGTHWPSLQAQSTLLHPAPFWGNSSLSWPLPSPSPSPTPHVHTLCTKHTPLLQTGFQFSPEDTGYKWVQIHCHMSQNLWQVGSWHLPAGWSKYTHLIFLNSLGTNIQSQIIQMQLEIMMVLGCPKILSFGLQLWWEPVYTKSYHCWLLNIELWWFQLIGEGIYFWSKANDHTPWSQRCVHRFPVGGMILENCSKFLAVPPIWYRNHLGLPPM